jgi:CUB/sushi domain-containing protein
MYSFVDTTLHNLTGLLATALVVGGQKTPKPSALQNVTITSVEDGDNYCLNVDFDYSGSGVCKCDVKSVQGRKKKSFGSVKQCMGKFTMLVGAGMYLVDIKCKSGKSSTTVSVPDDKECPTLEDIPNGSVDMTGVTVGSTATYTCNDNYQLMGASTRMCQPDGTWSGEEPMCIVTKEKMGQSLESIGQSILSISETGYCEVSEDCLHMKCTYRKTFDISGVLVVQEMHLFPCAKPLAISIKATLPTLGTFIDGVFTESKNITLISNGVPVEARIGIEQRPQRIAVTAEVEILGRIIYITPENAENEICMSCPGDCGHPGEIDNGQVDVSGGTMIGDTTNYQCNEHFELKGDNTRTCQEDGTWSGTAPTCLGKHTGTLGIQHLYIPTFCLI